MYLIVNDGIVWEIQRLLEGVKIVRTDEEIDRAIEARVEELNVNLGYDVGIRLAGIASNLPFVRTGQTNAWYAIVEAEGGVYDRLEIANEEALYDMRPDAW